MSETKDTKIFVWDLPTRLFHWLLVSLVVTSFITGLGWSGLDDEMDIHTWSGITILALVMFRLVWGFVGGRHARFTDFIKGPITVLKYAHGLVTGKHEQWLGHNPLGGLSVVAMVSLLGLQAGLGLFANDDSTVEGPLFDIVGKEISDFVTWLHYLNSNALYAVIGVHICAIIFYRFQGERLVAAMIHGYKNIKEGSATPAPDAKGNTFLAVAILVTCAGITALIINL